MEIPKVAMRAANNAMRGYIPHSGIVSAGAKKLYDYEETGLAPYEVRILIEREKALTEQVKKMQDW